jgi:hypothetical protein
MGLHAQIHQLDREVTISLCGEFRRPEIDQLQAILNHFHNRGCRRFVLDLSQIAPLSPAAKNSLNRLIGQGDSTLTERTIKGSAIRLLADSPVTPLPSGCGGLSFSVAS